MKTESFLVILLGCAMILILVSLIHPFWPTEGFQGEQVIVETVYTYEGGTPWNGTNVTQWIHHIKELHSSFHDIQDELQDTYKKYVATESQLETTTRKKHAHWLTMTPKQRQHAGMVEDPLVVYYGPMKSQSRLPLAGLKDNEGDLPYGIPQVSLPSPPATIQTGWQPRSSEESRFYEESKKYAAKVSDAVKRLAGSVDLLTWSTSGNQSASLLPRVNTIQAESEKQQKKLQSQRQKHPQGKQNREGFQDDTPTERIEKRVVTIEVYPYSSATEFVNRTREIFTEMRDNLRKTRDDILQATRILKKMNDKGRAAHDRMKRLVGN